MLAQYVNAYQSDWDRYLPLVAFQYNTTVNSQTGLTPFFMIYGREARQLCDQWIYTYASKDGLDDYVVKLIQVLAKTWEIAGDKKTEEVTRFNRIPIKRLPFTEYNVGDKFYRAVQPAPTYRHFTQAGIATKEREKDNVPIDDRGRHGKHGEKKISSNFQYRWIGPLLVTKKFSPVLYETIVNGKPEVIHAINMQKDPAINGLEPFLEKESTITPIRRNIHEYHTRKPVDGVIESQAERVITADDQDYDEETVEKVQEAMGSYEE
jgi:hypothetical protein